MNNSGKVYYGDVLAGIVKETDAGYEFVYVKDYLHDEFPGNWDTSGKRLHTRPGIVDTWTNWMVYIKFPEGIIKWLREHSPSDGYGNRPHKFRQFMSLIGKGSLLDFIDSAIDLMKKCSNRDQFKRLLAKGHNKTYQAEMFDKDDVNWQPRRKD